MFAAGRADGAKAELLGEEHKPDDALGQFYKLALARTFLRWRAGSVCEKAAPRAHWPDGAGVAPDLGEVREGLAPTAQGARVVVFFSTDAPVLQGSPVAQT